MKKRDSQSLVDFLLRTGLALAFLYAAVAQSLHPKVWIGWFPAWLGNIVNLGILIYVFSAIETALALWLLANKKTFHAALISALVFAGIIIFNLPALDVVFRDVALLFMALALAALHKDGQR